MLLPPHVLVLSRLRSHQIFAAVRGRPCGFEADYTRLQKPLSEFRRKALQSSSVSALGQFWVMRDGNYGKYGTPGNEESITCRFY